MNADRFSLIDERVRQELLTLRPILDGVFLVEFVKPPLGFLQRGGLLLARATRLGLPARGFLLLLRLPGRLCLSVALALLRLGEVGGALVGPAGAFEQKYTVSI
jgi:hypothetical protein